jgi:multiple sugar transport system permease protein
MEARVGETFRKRLVVFYIPLFLFLVALLFPFYWMLITSLKPDPELYNARNAPFFVWHPTLSH